MRCGLAVFNFPPTVKQDVYAVDWVVGYESVLT